LITFIAHPRPRAWTIRAPDPCGTRAFERLLFAGGGSDRRHRRKGTQRHDSRPSALRQTIVLASLSDRYIATRSSQPGDVHHLLLLDRTYSLVKEPRRFRSESAYCGTKAFALKHGRALSGATTF